MECVISATPSLEPAFRRNEISVQKVAHTPTLGKFVHRPESGRRASARDPNLHASLVVNRLQQNSLGAQACGLPDQKHRISISGRLFGGLHIHPKQPVQIAAEFSRREALQFCGARPCDHRGGGVRQSAYEQRSEKT